MTALVAGYTTFSSRIAGLVSSISKTLNNAEPVPHWVDFLNPSEK